MKKVFIVLIFISQSLFANTKSLPSLAPMLNQVIPSIVNISVQGVVTASDIIIDKRTKTPRTLPSRPKKFDSMGSGVIFDSHNGFIVTNAHVIKDAKTIHVTLHDGRRLKAKLIGADPETDVAVLQAKEKNLTALPFSDSQALKVGDFVVAIGNPFGLNSFGRNQSATFGIVSALQRNTLNIEGIENFIQTDAAINPGNSGGALVTSDGKLIGINTAILAPFGGNIGIGFAIPANMVNTVAKQLIQYGSVSRGLMGVFVQHLTHELIEAFKLPENTLGALVTQVNAGSPAEIAGLQSGDVIQQINGAIITNSAQVKTSIALLRIGSSAKIQLLRGNQVKVLNAIVTSPKQHEKTIQKASPFFYGTGLMNFAQQSPLHGFVQGVQLTGASEQSAAWIGGMRPGDVITNVNDQVVSDLKSLEKAIKARKNTLLVRVLRGPGALYLIIKE